MLTKLQLKQVAVMLGDLHNRVSVREAASHLPSDRADCREYMADIAELRSVVLAELAMEKTVAAPNPQDGPKSTDKLMLRVPLIRAVFVTREGRDMEWLPGPGCFAFVEFDRAQCSEIVRMGSRK